MIGEESLDHLLGIRPIDIQTLTTQIELRLSDNLSIFKGDKIDFSLDVPGLFTPSQTISLLLLPPAPQIPELKSTKSQRRIRSAGRKRGKYKVAGPMDWISKSKASWDLERVLRYKVGRKVETKVGHEYVTEREEKQAESFQKHLGIK